MRRGQQDTDCGTGDTCDIIAGFRGRRFYQTSNHAEFAAMLRVVSEELSRWQMTSPRGGNLRDFDEAAWEVTVVTLGPDSWCLTR